MEPSPKDAFEQAVENLLLAHGLKFHGIRLRCRQCQDQALAATPAMAQTFGWSNLKHTRGPNYTGLCAQCAER